MIVELTNMCLIHYEDKILFLNRTKSSWPGITFPGGHVEEGESIYDSVIREVKHETGLDIYNLKFVEIVEWNTNKNREISLLFEADARGNKTASSGEGKVFWAKLEDINPKDYSLDFDLILRKYKLI